MSPQLEIPPAFESQMRNMLKEDYASFHNALLAPPPVSVRLNLRKAAPFKSKRIVPWCATGRYLDERPSFTLDPHFHGGAYYVQEASSMFIEQALHETVDLSQSLRVLDLCAAPGGKSTHLVSLLSPESLLVSNEVIRSRASILSENIQKWGHSNVVVTNNDPSAFGTLGGFFDVILIDAPCSGEGMFRKDPDSVAQWSPEHVALCAARQKRIVEDVWPSLKNGGVLIYCTCTYNEQENEENLRWLSSNHEVQLEALPKAYEGITKVHTDEIDAYRLYPHRITGEGFFISMIRKGDDATAIARSKERGVKSRSGPAWLIGEFITVKHGELMIAVPAALERDVQWLSQHLNIVLRGTATGTDKHGKFIPDHAAALSVHLDHSQFPVIDLSREQALQYLRKDNLNAEFSQKGFCLVRFEGNALGWVNVLDTRTNNLYPAGWRIRMQ
jgi:NOL1/NOP2/sun family putative RNA methylase